MKTFKRIAAIGGSILLAASLTAAAYWFAVTAGTNLRTSELELTAQTAAVYDGAGKEIADISLKNAARSVPIGEIPLHVQRAFVAAEDKHFYSHHGLDYAGIARAIFKNIRARAFVQGASTISQQLVKNTHLSGEKTLERKLKEIKLTWQLERRYTKEEILEMYLNTIYFGHACYGIASAAEYYFGKDAQDLSAAEGAMLAAIIRSPNNYSPFADREKCQRARNAVLQRMEALGYLSAHEREQAAAEALPERSEGECTANAYLRAVYRELENLPLFTPYRFRGGCRIYTYMDAELQKYAEELKTDADRSGKSILVADNRTCGVTAWYSTEGELRRQPGSLIKPLAVYAPAIEENLISPCTPVLDKKADFGGYSPSNYRDDYRGYISAREALAESRNVPAVRILHSLGTDTSAQYMQRLGLPVAECDRTLSLALGGVSEGYTPRELAGAYAALAAGGTFTPLRFIKRIEGKGGETLYERREERRRAFSADTAALVSDMLQSAVKQGTAKKLSALPFPVCAKTGTCGTEAGNTDAWAAAYTSEHTVIVWMGNADNTRTDISGGGLPCHYALLLHRQLYKGGAPAPFRPCKGVVECCIDRAAYEREHAVRLAAKKQPRRYVLRELFRAGNTPKERGTLFETPSDSASITCRDGTVTINVCHAEYYAYVIKRRMNGKTELLYDGNLDGEFSDGRLQYGHYIYSVTPYFIDDEGERIYGAEEMLPSVCIREPIQPKREPPQEWWLR